MDHLGSLVAMRFLPLLASMLHLFTASGAEVVADPRPGSWAEPIELVGVPNLHRVTNGLYRSAQPTAEGMKNLAAMGVKTVIELRQFHDDEAELKGTSLTPVEFAVATWHIEDEDVVRVLARLRDPTGAPYLIHCQHGADRTGVMCAMYRMVEQHWTRDQAIAEMTTGGYGFHAMWTNLVQYLGEVEVEAIRSQISVVQTATK